MSHIPNYPSQFQLILAHYGPTAASFITAAVSTIRIADASAVHKMCQIWRVSFKMGI